MVNSQEGLHIMGGENATAKSVGLLVIGAVVGLVLLRRISVSGAISAG